MFVPKLNLLFLFICISILGYTQPILPTSISGLKLWFRADSLVFINNDSVYKLSDLSGNNNHANQPILNQQPKLVNNTLNNLPVIRFDGVDDYLYFSGLTNIKDCFFVLKHATGSQDYATILGSLSSYDFIGGNDSSLFSSLFTSPGILSGTIEINNVLLTLTNAFKPKNYSLLYLQPTSFLSAENIGNDRNTANRFWNGDFAEIIVFDKNLTVTEKNIVVNYLNKKYTKQINLGNDITISNNVCDTSLTPQNSEFTNYQWSTGANTPTISVNKSGKYWVTATNIFGKTTSDTILVNYPNYNPPIQNFICPNGQLIWNTQLPKSNYTFIWQDNSTDSVFMINQAGNYYIKITDSFSCSITSDTVKIVEDNFSTTASLGPDISLCSGNSITLTSGANPLLTYTWSNGSQNDSLLVTTSDQYSVIVTNTNNCIAKDTINITISGQSPIANFSSSVGCFNSVVSFTNLSTPPIGNTITNSNWNFGDPLSATNTSTTSNTFHTFSDTGTYYVNLKVTTNTGCEKSITKTIHIAPTPTVNFSNGISCQNDSTAFSSSIISSPGYSITSTFWNFGDPASGIANTSNLLSPKHLFSNQITYSVTFIATNSAGCQKSLTKTLIVKGEVTASFTNSPLCSNTPIIFQDNSTVPIPSSQFSRLWNFGTSTTTGLTATKTYTSSGVYSVTLTVTGTGTNNCTSKIAKQIIVFLPPVANFTIPPFCSKDTITITNQSIPQSGTNSSYNWKLNNTSFSTVQNPTLTTSAGTYSVRLTVINSFNCKDSITKPVTVLPLPNVDFTTNPTSYYYINSPINFIPTFTNTNSYLWNITSIPTSTIQSPTASFSAEGSYSVSLYSQDQQGCKNSITKTILITKRYLDLAVVNINATKDNDGFLTVEADIANYGTLPVTSFDVYYQISDAGNVKETWNGTLNPNSFYAYTFNAKSVAQKNNSNNLFCVEIKKANNIIDENTGNNTICNTLNTDEISVSNPIPNPTDGDITLPIILNNDLDFVISIYNSTGQIVYEETTQKGAAGLNFITLPTSSYSRGCYIIKTMIDGKVFIKKIIKINNK